MQWIRTAERLPTKEDYGTEGTGIGYHASGWIGVAMYNERWRNWCDERGDLYDENEVTHWCVLFPPGTEL